MFRSFALDLRTTRCANEPAKASEGRVGFRRFGFGLAPSRNSTISRSGLKVHGKAELPFVVVARVIVTSARPLRTPTSDFESRRGPRIVMPATSCFSVATSRNAGFSKNAEPDAENRTSGPSSRVARGRSAPRPCAPPARLRGGSLRRPLVVCRGRLRRRACTATAPRLQRASPNPSLQRSPPWRSRLQWGWAHRNRVGQRCLLRRR